MNHTINLLMSQFVTHDVKRFIFSKPSGFSVVRFPPIDTMHHRVYTQFDREKPR